MSKYITLVFLFFLPHLLSAQIDTMTLKTVEGITDKMLALISGEIDEPIDWEEFKNLFLPTAQLIALNPDASPNRQVMVMTLEEFIQKIGPIYARDGFLEVSTGLTINEYNGIATVFQSYHAKNLKGTYDKKGINCYQLIYSKNRWWIANSSFVNENQNNKIPNEYLDSGKK